jgi:uncharacterized protein (TIGR04222 family)
MGLGPFDLTGEPFLALYSVLFALAVLASLWLPRWLRPEGRSGAVQDMDRLAFLTGGAGRFAEARLARLYTRGSLTIDRKRGVTLKGRPADAEDAADMAVLGLSSPATYSALSRALKPYAEKVGEKLAGAGLLIDPATALQLRLLQTLPLLVLLVFGATKWEIGTLRDKPVGYLTVFLIVTLLLAIVRFAVIDRRTHGGIAVAEDACRRLERLRRAAPTDEAGMAVALFGTAALVGSTWYELHLLRRDNSSGGDGGSSSSDGGGCGGGGCGGCGG